MARLNEPPAASALVLPQAESVDACRFNPLHLLHATAPSCTMRTKSKQNAQPPAADLGEVKRRFIRQNRELAKNNSTQSLRIRHLEIEVSRLLSDNLDLREHVLQLQNEIDRAHAGSRFDTVEKVRDELKAKLAELGSLVVGLDNAVREARPMEVAREKGVVQGQWRERQPLIEAMRDSQLPTITEHKLYPRRTLDAAEIQSSRLSDHHSNGSPDLGSPPVARFDYGEQERPISPALPSPVDEIEQDALPGKLLANLETRRSRKGDPSKIRIQKGSLLSQSPTKAEPETAALIIRTGAKRKLADREFEQKLVKPPMGEDFAFTRRGARAEEEAENSGPSRRSRSPAEDSSEGEPGIPQQPARRVLGDKSTNISPRKMQSVKVTEKDSSAKPAKSDSTNARRQSRARRVSSLPVPSSPNHIVPTSEPPAALDVHLEALIGPEDLFSPTPSVRTAGLSENRDTPPPTNLSTAGLTTEEARPSRRARSAVNYAEPSLVAKMRRPGKELADAISGLQDPRLAMNTTTKTGKSLATQKVIRIKKEPHDEGDEVDWERLAPIPLSEQASPLRSKGTASPVSEAGTTQPKPDSLDPSVSSTNLQAKLKPFTTGARSRRDAQQSDDTDLVSTIQKTRDLDIYEFKESSSGPAVTKKPGHRRQSSVPKKLETVPLEEELKDPLSTTIRSERVASRRRSMML